MGSFGKKDFGYEAQGATGKARCWRVVPARQGVGGVGPAACHGSEYSTHVLFCQMMGYRMRQPVGAGLLGRGWYRGFDCVLGGAPIWGNGNYGLPLHISYCRSAECRYRQNVPDHCQPISTLCSGPVIGTCGLRSLRCSALAQKWFTPAASAASGHACGGHFPASLRGETPSP